MKDIFVRTHDKNKYTVELDCSTPTRTRTLHIDVDKRPDDMIRHLNLAGRKFNQLKNDYPELKISDTPKYPMMIPKLKTYLQMFEEFEDAMGRQSLFPYSSFAHMLCINFKGSGSVGDFFKDTPVATATLDNLDLDDNVTESNLIDLVELTNAGKYYLRLSLDKKLGMGMPDIEQVVYSIMKNLGPSYNNNANPNFNYAEAMRKERERRMEAERDEMLRQLRAANRWNKP